MATKIAIEPTLHAHRCENCFRNGVTTVWVHDNSHAGEADDVKVAAGHTCPKCGATEWKKWLLPVAQLPEQKQQQQFVQFVSLQEIESILMSAFWIVVLIAMLGVVYFTYRKMNNGGTGTAA